jgi:autotransporter-associated beta strand protein
MTFTSPGTPATIQTANAVHTPFNIALSGTLTGAGSLRKTGLGTLTLSQSASTYSGGTIIEQGTLLVSAPNGIATGTGPITVCNSATYAGAGNNLSVGHVTVQSGGHIAPGLSAGSSATLNFRNLSLDAGAYVDLDVAIDGLTHDTLRLLPGGTLTLASPVNVRLQHLGQTFAIPGTYTLFTGLQNLVGSPSSLQVVSPAGGRSYAFAHSGSELLLTITNAGGGPIAGQWMGTLGSDWNASANWSGGQIPGAQGGDSATFGPSPTSFDVRLNASQRLAAWSIHSGTGYTFASGVGGARLMLDNGTGYAFVSVTAGIHSAAHDVVLASPTQVTLGTATQLTLSGAVSNGTSQSATSLLVTGGGTLVLSGSTAQGGVTTVAAGRLRVVGAGPHSFASVTGPGTMEIGAGCGVLSDGVTTGEWVVDGTHVIRLNGASQGVSRVEALTIAGTPGQWTGKVDLGDNPLIVDSVSQAAQAVVISRLMDQIASGRAGGTWAGKGITSSVLVGPRGTSYGLALTDAGDLNLVAFGGHTDLDVNTTLLVVARNGDATLDGTVDAFDLNILAAHWQLGAGAIWSGGDFTGDGQVDAFDLNLLAANWQLDGDNLSTTIQHIAQLNTQFVPEPTSLTILACGLPALLTRRRNRKKSLKLICTSGDSGVFTSKPLLGVQVMRRIVPLALAAAVGIGFASHANAAITTSVVPVQINATLEAAGWSGYYIVLTADAASQNKITTLDFKNDPLTLGGTIGISAPLHQRWGIGFDNNALKPTPSSAATSLDASSTTLRRDSVFLNSTYYNVAVTDAFTENNNLQNGTAPTGSPLADVPTNPDTETDGANHGVGSIMTFSGAANVATALGTLNVAFVIVPSGGTWVPGYNASALATVQGAALDPSSTDKTKAFPVRLSYVSAIPEPASLGVLALGGLSLLARRRKA